MNDNSDILYCTQCGAEMRKSNKLNGYDQSSGRPVYKTVWKCSKRNFYNFLFHDSYSSNPIYPISPISPWSR